MINNNVHKIEKHSLVVEMENPPDAFEFKNRLGELLHEQILPQMEVLFNDLTAGNQLIRMDILEIDAGHIEFNNWERNLTEAIIKALKKSLAVQSPVWTNTTVSALNNKQTTIVTNNIDRQNPNGLPAFEEVLFCYLQHNYLPWYVPLNYRLQQQFIWWLKTNPQKAITLFLNTAPQIQIERFVYVAGVDGCQQVVTLLLPSSTSNVSASITALRQFFARGITPAITQPVTLLKLLYLPFFTGFSLQQVSNATFNKNFIALVAAQLAIEVQNVNVINRVAKNINDELVNQLVAAIKANANHLPKKNIEPDTPAPNQEALPAASYIANAGLVLLHPFLPTLFEALSLTDKNNFLSNEAHMRAVVLTQYLVTGQYEYEDHMLLLNKIMCGYPVNKPIASGIELTVNEVDEAAQLLLHCISLWTKNGVQVNPTADGLQSSFLLREGKITCNSDYQLQVQQKPYDMVMSALPWGISIIKTPFMKVLLWVDWA